MSRAPGVPGTKLGPSQRACSLSLLREPPRWDTSSPWHTPSCLISAPFVGLLPVCPCFCSGFCPPHSCSRGLSCPPSFPSFLHGLLNGSSGSAPLMGKATSRQTWSLPPWGSQGGLSHRVRQTSRKSPGRVSLPTRPPGEWWLWCRGGVFQRSPRVGARTS